MRQPQLFGSPDLSFITSNVMLCPQTSCTHGTSYAGTAVSCIHKLPLARSLGVNVLELSSFVLDSH